MAVRTAGRLCIYCDSYVGRVRKGEHIIQEAIGGALTVRTVCASCNNTFSNIDAELCSRSPLSIVASQQIDAHLWQAWDVDHSDSDMLLEAYPNWAAESLTLYPQIVFDSTGPQLRGDMEEITRFGSRGFEQVIVKSMLRAFRRHEAGLKRWLHFERVEKDQIIERGYRLPPRIFPRMSIDDLADRLVRGEQASFIIRYQTDADRRRVLNAIETWNPAKSFRSFGGGIGSALPVFGCYYDMGKVFRALAKMAVNLLAHFCPNTPINRKTIGPVVRVIRGKSPVSPELLAANGFVHAADVASIKTNGNDHSFRLLHWDDEWLVYSSFFGGRIGSFVRFPGPNKESWRCADIVAPIGSAEWTVVTRDMILPLKVHIEWQDPSKIIPAIKMLNSASRLVVEDARTTS